MTHTCHWPDCGTPVPPKLWGCKKHWFMLPKRLRDLIWATYVPGQEITKTPSQEYLQAAAMVQQWIEAWNFAQKKMVELAKPECDCLVPALEGAGQHSPTCAIFKKAP